VLETQKVLGNTLPLRLYEHSLLKNVDNEMRAPLFIIGAPRTGSTLLYQLLIQNFYLSYFNNLQSFFYGSPALIAKLTQKFQAKKSFRQVRQSHYGYIPGLFSPSESGAIFRYWFDDSNISTQMSSPMGNDIRRTIAYLSTTHAVPFIAKNLYNALRLNTISAVLPEAVFIWIKRHPLYAGQSLINMRRKLYGSDDVWASIKPPSYKKIIRCSPFEQVVRQVMDIEDYISRYFGKKKNSKFITVEYEALCDRPKQILDTIEERYEYLAGYKLQRKPCRHKVSLKARNARQLSESEWKQLKDTVDHMSGASA
jgi:hypothetical protein